MGRARARVKRRFIPLPLSLPRGRGGFGERGDVTSLNGGERNHYFSEYLNLLQEVNNEK